MENRKRNVQIIIRVTEEERALIEEKMQQIPTLNLSAYARKMLIDGYIITLDLQEIKGHTAQLQKIGMLFYECRPKGVPFFMQTGNG